MESGVGRERDVDFVCRLLETLDFSSWLMRELGVCRRISISERLLANEKTYIRQTRSCLSP
jgi:hypothetical protein